MTAWPDPARPGLPLNPEQEGPHWLRYEHDGYVEVSAFLWERDGYWVKSRHVHYSEWPGRWTYLDPVLSHDEATALQARVAELEGVLQRLLSMNDDHGLFGGEINLGRIDRAWDKARAALEGKKDEPGEN